MNPLNGAAPRDKAGSPDVAAGYRVHSNECRDNDVNPVSHQAELSFAPPHTTD